MSTSSSTPSEPRGSRSEGAVLLALVNLLSLFALWGGFPMLFPSYAAWLGLPILLLWTPIAGLLSIIAIVLAIRSVGARNPRLVPKILTVPILVVHLLIVAVGLVFALPYWEVHGR